MEEPTPSTSSQTDMFNSLSPSSKPEDKWPSLSSTASSIQPAQKAPSMPTSWTAQTTKKIPPQDHRKNWGKYSQYFQGNKILPIPELVQEVQPKTNSFAVTDLKTRRLAGLRKDTFEEILKAAGIPAKYYCRRSFATWDDLQPTEELTIKLAGDNITKKYFRLQPEYLGQRRIKVTVCNVPIQLNSEVLAAYLCKHGEVEDIIKIKSSNGTEHGDYFFTMCLNRKGFQAIPHTIEYESQLMTVIVEGRKPQCWFCKQLGHFSRSCPQKTSKSTSSPPTPLTTTTTTTTTAATTRPNTETRDHPNKSEEGWTQVTRGRKKKSPLKEQIKEATTATSEKKNQINQRH